MKYYNLFIDELGNANPQNLSSPIYILCGIMVTGQNREKIKIHSDQIKFKYWGRTNVIFHSREIGRCEGEFHILKDKKINKTFIEDLTKFLQVSSYQIFAIIIDKNKIPKNWVDNTVYKKTSDQLIKNYILSLLAQKNCKGRLIIESATSEKDFYYHKAAGYYLSRGFPELGIEYNKVQDVITEISFVTKKNFDIEEQIADLLAYGIKAKYQNTNQKSLAEYEKKLIKIVNSKLFIVNPKVGKVKGKIYSEIKSFITIP